MPSEEEWKELIASAVGRRPDPTPALEYRMAPLGSFAAPPLLVCGDGGEYWVKYPMAGDGCPPNQRTNQLGGMVTDHLVGTLAKSIAWESVPPVRLVAIGTELITAERRLANACAGLAHGSKNASTNCTGRSAFSHGGHNKLPINRPRVASLAVLYGLAFAADHQVIYQLGGEPLVFSVDHGHFFPGGPNWNAAGLTNASSADVDETILRECELTTEDLSMPLRRLEALTPAAVAEAVAAPPDDWLFSEADRVAVAHYLWSRRDAILQKNR
jgi:hypothetical protein